MLLYMQAVNSYEGQGRFNLYPAMQNRPLQKVISVVAENVLFSVMKW